MLKRISVFLIALTLSGCAAPALTDKKIFWHKDYVEDGLVFGTVTFTDERAGANGYYFRVSPVSENGEKSGEFGFSANSMGFKMKHDGDLNAKKSYLFLLRKPPGDYVIDNLRMASVTVTGHGYDKNAIKFTIPIEVKKGQITYVGEILIDEWTDEKKQAISVSDQFIRDMNAMKNKQPNVNWPIAVRQIKQPVFKTE